LANPGVRDARLRDQGGTARDLERLFFSVYSNRELE
jgi:hypothetical protein